MHFMAVKKKRKHSGFFVYSYLIHRGFPAVKKDAKYVGKGTIYVSIEGIL